jgi:hypothetical protein
MLEYLEKFKLLDEKLRQSVSSPEVMAKITELEKVYGVNLSELVIRIMVKDLALPAVPAYLVSDLKLELNRAGELFDRLRQEVLLAALPYLENKPGKKNDLPVVRESLSPALTETVKPQEKVSLVFHPDDEVEAQKLLESKVSQLASGTDWTNAVNQIISLSKLSFGSEVLNDRLKSILLSYLKGVRNKVDTKLFLGKGIAEGGVALDEKTVDYLLILAQEFIIKPEIAKSKPRVRVEEDDFLNRDVPYDFAAASAKKSSQSIGAGTALPEGISDPYAFGRPKEAIGKVAMDDIKATAPRVMNQLDELRFIDLPIFRRLSRDPSAAIERIKEKIGLLEMENYRKRLEGVMAWRQSPVNRIYLKISEESITSKKPVSQIIQELESSGQPHLSPVEFVAIMKLNKDLRY